MTSMPTNKLYKFVIAVFVACSVFESAQSKNQSSNHIRQLTHLHNRAKRQQGARKANTASPQHVLLSYDFQAYWTRYWVCSPRRVAEVAGRQGRALSINWRMICSVSCRYSTMRMRCVRTLHGWAFCCPWTSFSGA